MKVLEGVLKGEGKRVGLVVSRFNEFFSKNLLEGALDCLRRHGVKEDHLTVVWVPGTLELPLAGRKLAAAGGVDAVVLLGMVIQGGTSHAEHVNAQISRAVVSLSLETGIPFTLGVVSAENLDQAVERSGSKAGNRGWQAALAALEMANLMGVMK